MIHFIPIGHKLDLLIEEKAKNSRAVLKKLAVSYVGGSPKKTDGVMCGLQIAEKFCPGLSELTAVCSANGVWVFDGNPTNVFSRIEKINYAPGVTPPSVLVKMVYSRIRKILEAKLGGNFVLPEQSRAALIAAMQKPTCLSKKDVDHHTEFFNWVTVTDEVIEKAFRLYVVSDVMTA